MFIDMPRLDSGKIAMLHLFPLEKAEYAPDLVVIAYSDDSGHLFRSIPATCSDPFRPPIPDDSGHPPGGRRWS
jgi:hypothetical protein